MSPPGGPGPRLPRWRCSALSAHPMPSRPPWPPAPPEPRDHDGRLDRRHLAACGASRRQVTRAWTRRDTVMDARQMTAMAEATRLTRQGRLVEATALIQQTLAGPAVTRPAGVAPPAGEVAGRAPRLPAAH